MTESGKTVQRTLTSPVTRVTLLLTLLSTKKYVTRNISANRHSTRNNLELTKRLNVLCTGNDTFKENRTQFVKT